MRTIQLGPLSNYQIIVMQSMLSVELDVNVDAAVINLVPPTFSVIGTVKVDMVRSFSSSASTVVGIGGCQFSNGLRRRAYDTS